MVLVGWVKCQIVYRYIVCVEAKQQFLSEIPYVGAILSVVSARIPHTSDSPPKAEPLIHVNEYCCVHV